MIGQPPCDLFPSVANCLEPVVSFIECVYADMAARDKARGERAMNTIRKTLMFFRIMFKSLLIRFRGEAQ